MFYLRDQFSKSIFWESNFQKAFFKKNIKMIKLLWQRIDYDCTMFKAHPIS